jgi:hypothetical protein
MASFTKLEMRVSKNMGLPIKLQRTSGGFSSSPPAVKPNRVILIIADLAQDRGGAGVAVGAVIGAFRTRIPSGAFEPTRSGGCSPLSPRRMFAEATVDKKVFTATIASFSHGLV